MDRPKIKKIKTEALAALEKIAAKHGLQVTYKGGKFDEASYLGKFEFVETTADGGNAKADLEWTHFKAFQPSLKNVELGAYFVVGGTRYKLVSVKPRSPKWPIIGEGPRGGKYKFQLKSLVGGLL